MYFRYIYSANRENSSMLFFNHLEFLQCYLQLYRKRNKKNKLFNNLLFFKSRPIFSYHKRASLKRTIYKIVYCSAAPRINKDNSEILTWRAFCKMSRNRWKQNFPEIGHKVIETLGTDNRSSSVFRVCDRFSTITELIDDYHLYSLFYKEI